MGEPNPPLDLLQTIAKHLTAFEQVEVIEHPRESDESYVSGPDVAYHMIVRVPNPAWRGEEEEEAGEPEFLALAVEVTAIGALIDGEIVG